VPIDWERLINLQLSDFFSPENIKLWWDTPNSYIDYRTPRDYLTVDPEGLYNKVATLGR
jgi:hypothetical protein